MKRQFKHGWQPTAGMWELAAPTLPYKNSMGGSVLTQFWRFVGSNVSP
jgi:hypothetical protein